MEAGEGDDASGATSVEDQHYKEAQAAWTVEDSIARAINGRSVGVSKRRR